MTRGSNRKDVPLTNSEWINYDCPVESWEYWERCFKKKFSDKFRKDLILAVTDYRAYRKAYNEPATTDQGQRLDAKQIKRELQAAIRAGDYRCAQTKRFVEIYNAELYWPSTSKKAEEFLREVLFEL